MTVVSLNGGFVREARAEPRAVVGKFLTMLTLGTAIVVCASGKSRADSGREWIEATFKSSPVKAGSKREFAKPRKLGAYMPAAERPQRRRSKNMRLASLGPITTAPEPSAPSGNVSGGRGNIQWVANANCLAPSLRAVIADVAAQFGKVRVSSTCRSHKHNRRVGGARRSYHLSGSAADFRVFGNVKAAFVYLRSAVGGLKHYGGGLFHVDTGPRRPM